MNANKDNDFGKQQMAKLVKLMLGWATLLFLFIFWLKKGSGLTMIEQKEYLLSLEFIIPFLIISIASLVTMERIINNSKTKKKGS